MSDASHIYQKRLWRILPSLFQARARGYTDEQEKKHGLVFNYTNSEKDQYVSVEKGIQLLKANDAKEKARMKRMKLVDTIDVTDFMIKLALELAS